MRRKIFNRVVSGAMAAILALSSFGGMSAVSAAEIQVRTDTNAQMSSDPEVVYVNTYGNTSREQNFDENWKFYLGDASGAESVTYDDSRWENVNLPHDYSIEQEYTSAGEAESAYLLGGTGWYRKYFTLADSLEGKEIRIDFGGVYMDSTVWVNGTQLGTHPYGYTPFSFDITDYVKFGQENVIAVKVNHQTPSSRWYSGSGIYRSVNLTVMDKVHVDLYGTKIKTPNLKTEQGGVVNMSVSTNVANAGTDAANVVLTHTIYEKGTTNSIGTVTTEAQSVAANGSAQIEATLPAQQPKLWSTKTPNLYTVVTEVKVGDDVVDTYETEYGFRYISFDANTGFYLNGEKVKLKGVCMHHDQGSLGSEAYYRAIERQVEILKEMGCNSIRVTHNPAADELIEICNEKGILVIDEFFDGWHNAKNGNSYDYARFFSKKIETGNQILGAEGDMIWAEFDLKATIGRGENAPSVIMWSLGNEIQEGAGGSGYSTWADSLIAWAQETGTTKLLTIGSNAVKNGIGNSNNEHVQIANKLTAVGGVSGTNYSDGNSYDSIHRTYPDWFIYGSETASHVNSRGVYNVTGSQALNADKALTSYDYSAVGWGATASSAWYDVITRDFVAGEYVWTGFDYMGEPTPNNGTGAGWVNGSDSPKNSFFGIIDTAGLPKDNYYFYQSQWNDEVTTLHVLPAWNREVLANPNNVPVVVYSDAASVKLTLTKADGTVTDLGTKTFTEKTTSAGYKYQIYEGEGKESQTHRNLYLTWYVPYQDGTLTATAYDANGNEITDTVGRSYVTTAGAAAKLEATVDRAEIKADGKDLAYITVDVTDAEGNIVPNASNNVRFVVEGDGVLVGVDNGKQSDHQSFQDNNRDAFNGSLIAIVQSTKENGSFTVKAISDGLETASVNVTTTPVEGGAVAEKQVNSFYMSKNYYVMKGSELKLPDTIKTRYTDGTEEVLPVTWGTMGNTNETGMFTVQGVVEDYNVSVIVNVIDEVGGLLNYSTSTPVGVEPNLPDTRPAVLMNGEILNVSFAVDWDEIPAANYAEVGNFVVEGTANVLGKAIDVTASVRVAEQQITIGGSVSDAAYVTQVVGNPSDTLNAIKDGSTAISANTSGGANPSCWSNWDDAQKGVTKSELTFRYDTNQTVGEIVIHFGQDSSSGTFPDAGTTEIYSSTDGGNTWNKLAFEETLGTESENVKPYTYSFAAPFDAELLKFCITNSPNQKGSRKPCTMITEIEVLRAVGKYTTNTTAKLASLTVNGKEATEKEIASGMFYTLDQSAEVVAVGKDNAAVTVLPANEDQIIVIIESEDHYTRNEFVILLGQAKPILPDDDSKDIPVDKLTAFAESVYPGTGNEGPASLVLDNNASTHWHTNWNNTEATDVAKRWIGLKWDELTNIDGIRFKPRSGNGAPTEYRVEYRASESDTWTAVASGTWNRTDSDWKLVTFKPVKATQVRLVGVHTWADSGNDAHMSAAEFRVTTPGDVTPEPPVEAVLTEISVKTAPKTEYKVGDEFDPTGLVLNLVYSDGQVSELAYSTDAGITFNVTGALTAESTAVEITYNGLTTTQAIVVKAAAVPEQPGTPDVPEVEVPGTPIEAPADAYEIYPIPRTVQYYSGSLILRNQTNVVYEKGIDEATKARLEETMALKGVKVTEANAVVDGKTNILVGIYGSEGYADKYVKANYEVSEGLFDKTDAYFLAVSEDTIVVLGKDADAAFYGLTTLYHIFAQTEGKTIYNFTMEDYADVVSRGFIEGYYGNPWSLEDRMELMTWGGYYKLNSYFYAPKDDPKHNAKWRELYTQEEIDTLIKPLAEAGNASKCRFVFALHPYMYNAIRYSSEAAYQEDLAIMQAKFAQVIEAGVRQIAILADDAGNVGGSNYIRTLEDMTDWIREMQKTYPDLKITLPFCTQEYMYNGESYYANFPENVQIVMTGGRVWGEVSNNFTTTFTNNVGRGPYLWINWPCTDNSKKHLIMGGYSTFLHPNVDPSKIEGIVLNPMQQSEPSKVAIFGNATYSWNIWDSIEEADKAWEASFAFVDHNSAVETKASEALKELSKHMINQNMDSRVTALQESVEIKDTLNSFKDKLLAGTVTKEECEEIIVIFEELQKAAEVYSASGNSRIKAQIVYWLNCWADTTNAAISLLEAIEADIDGNANELLTKYNDGSMAFAQSKTYGFHYVDHTEYAEVGVQHIVPFITAVESYVSKRAELVLNPDAMITTYITSRKDVPTGSVDNILDGNESTVAIYKSPNQIDAGEYVGLLFSKVIDITNATFVLGAGKDHFDEARVEYTMDGKEWIALDGTYTGVINQVQRVELTEETLPSNFQAMGIRLIATRDNANDAWLEVRDISVNTVKNTEEPVDPSIYNNILKPSDWTVYQTYAESRLYDGDDNSFVWYDTGSDDTFVAGDALGYNFGSVLQLASAHIVVGNGGDKFMNYAVETSLDGETWTLVPGYESYTGNSTKDTLDIPLRGLEAQYIRIRSLTTENKWVKFSEFTVKLGTGEAAASNENVYTNVNNVEVYSAVEEGRVALTGAEVTLKAGEYVGIDLKNIKLIKNIAATATGDVKLQTSLNAINWEDAGETYADARYIRLFNTGSADASVTVDGFAVNFDSISAKSVESNLGNSDSSRDMRTKGNVADVFDGNLGTYGEICSTQTAGGHITFDLGQTVALNTLRYYIVETNRDFLRHAKFEASVDGKEWTEVLVVGTADAVNSMGIDSVAKDAPYLTHDSSNPGYMYTEAKDLNTSARYLRVTPLTTYSDRWMQFNEIQINGGAYLTVEDNRDIVSDTIEVPYQIPSNALDGNFGTYYENSATSGSFTYRLSAPQNVEAIRIIQLRGVSNATVTAEFEDMTEATGLFARIKTFLLGTDVKIGTLSQSINEFNVPDGKWLKSITVTWDGKAPVISEILTLKSKSDATEVLEEINALLATDVKVDNWTKDTKAAYETAVANAEEAKDNEYISKVSAQNVLAALQSAINNGVEKYTKNELKVEVENAVSNQNEVYTAKSFAAYEEALTEAQIALADKDNLSAVDGDALYSALTAAKEALVYTTGNKEIAQLLVKDMNKYTDASKYTESSWKALQDAKKALEDLIAADTEANRVNPSEYADVIATAEAAIENLTATDKPSVSGRYTITYELDGGKNSSKNPATFTKKTKTITLKAPTKKGYTFKGWYKNADYSGKKVTQIKKGTNKDITLYAKWSANTYKITYKLNGGKNNTANPKSYKITTATVELQNPTRKGYTFAGWYSNKKLTKEVTEITEGSTGKKTLYAKWKKDTYQITYELDGGKNNRKNPTSYKVTSATIKLKNPSREGYTFKGWYKDADYSGKKVTQIKKGSAGAVTLYAKWEEKSK